MKKSGRTKETILKVLQNHQNTLRKLGVKKLSLFGSYARGKNTQKSDLDFLVEFEKKTFDAYMELKFFLEELFDQSVDLVIADALKKRLRPYIMKELIHVPGL